LYGYYRRYYVPNNATLVVVGDVDAKDAMRRIAHHFDRIEARPLERRAHTAEPEQLGERRVTVARPGTTAYLKVAYHAPALGDADFFAVILLDAVLTGAKGLNLWSSFRTPPPQRSARLYRALVDKGLASSVIGALLPTEDPFLYTISLTATEGISLRALEEATLTELDRVRSGGITAEELAKVKNQLRARLVFENDSVTNIAHQLGYYETVATWDVYLTLLPRIQAVTLEEVNAAASRYLRATNRTVGVFDPVPDLAGV
jgi:zinc protease